MGRIMNLRWKPIPVLAAAACAAALVSTPAAADTHSTKAGAPPGVSRVLASTLNGPRQVSASHGRLYVAESDTGQITSINPRTQGTRVVVTGLASPQGVVRIGGKIYVATGGAEDSGPGAQDAPAIMVARPGQAATRFADMLGYELAHNPDGQTQFGPDGKPVDALSNPYFLLRDRSRHGFLLVADAGGNAVLKVSRSGKVSTLFVPPTITTGGCATTPENDPGTFGCDSVPTGLAYGPDGLLYVSALTSEVAGQGRVYVVNPRTGKRVRTISGLTAPTGVAVDSRRNVYVSQVLEGAPEGDGPPPAGFDPADVGQIVRVSRDGRRSYAQVTMPSGLLWRHGTLISSTWAIAAFLQIPDAGQVVTVDPRAFIPTS